MTVAVAKTARMRQRSRSDADHPDSRRVARVPAVDGLRVSESAHLSNGKNERAVATTRLPGPAIPSTGTSHLSFPSTRRPGGHEATLPHGTFKKGCVPLHLRAEALLHAHQRWAARRLHYIGNVPGTGEDTICPACRKVVLSRHGFRIPSKEIRGGACGFCGEKIAGVRS